MKQYLEAGKIVGTHGVKGEVRTLSFCRTKEELAGFRTLYMDDKGERAFAVASGRVHKNIVILKLAEIDTPQKADALRNRVLYANREDIPLSDGEYFHQDIIGLEVIDAESGGCYGKVSDILNNGGGDIFEIVEASGKKVLISAEGGVVKGIELQRGRLLICPIKGMFA
jgi:16S rRNA processing protein RimM